MRLYRRRVRFTSKKDRKLLKRLEKKWTHHEAHLLYSKEFGEPPLPFINALREALGLEKIRDGVRQTERGSGLSDLHQHVLQETDPSGGRLYNFARSFLL